MILATFTAAVLGYYVGRQLFLSELSVRPPSLVFVCTSLLTTILLPAQQMIMSLCFAVGMMVIEMLLFIIRESIAETRAIATARLKAKRNAPATSRANQMKFNDDLYHRKNKTKEITAPIKAD
jgi:hypothetical protein